MTLNSRFIVGNNDAGVTFFWGGRLGWTKHYCDVYRYKFMFQAEEAVNRNRKKAYSSMVSDRPNYDMWGMAVIVSPITFEKYVDQGVYSTNQEAVK